MAPPAYYQVTPASSLGNIVASGLPAHAESDRWEHKSNYGVYLWIDFNHALNYLRDNVDHYQDPIILKIDPSSVREDLIVADEDEYLAPGLTPVEHLEHYPDAADNPIFARMLQDGLLQINDYGEAIKWIGDFIVRHRIKPQEWSGRYLDDIPAKGILAAYRIEGRKPVLIWPRDAAPEHISTTIE